MDLNILGCPEHDFTIYTKCLSICNTDFMAALAQKLMDGIAWNYTLSCIIVAD